jgi:general secretion pathway protein I
MQPLNAVTRWRWSGGFTLLEVMIALAVVSIGLIAASSSIGHITSNGVYLRDKTVGHWIAMNKLAEMRLDATWPGIGKSDDEMDYAGQRWHWTAEVSQTDVETLRRIDLTVARKNGHDERTVAKLSGFVGQPRVTAGLPASWTGMASQPHGQQGGDQQTQPPPQDNGDDQGNQGNQGDENSGDSGDTGDSGDQGQP